MDYLHKTISGVPTDPTGLQDGYTFVYDTASGKFKPAKGGTGSGGATDKWPSKMITDNYQSNSKEFGYTYIVFGCDNTNGEVIIGLPDVSETDLGAWYRIVKAVPNCTVSIMASNLQSIMDSGEGGKLFNSTSEMGSSVEIQLVSIGTWLIVSGLGTWVTDPKVIYA